MSLYLQLFRVIDSSPNTIHGLLQPHRQFAMLVGSTDILHSISSILILLNEKNDKLNQKGKDRYNNYVIRWGDLLVQIFADEDQAELTTHPCGSY